jgi:hypothetical protein
MAASNFAFLRDTEPELYGLAVQAERSAREAPTTCLRELRTFGEMLTERILAHTGGTVAARTQHDRLVALRDRGHLPKHVADRLHRIRMGGNKAVHENRGTPSRALRGVEDAWEAARWLQAQLHPHASRPRRFHAPAAGGDGAPEPPASSLKLKAELEALRTRLAAVEVEREARGEEKDLGARIAELEEQLRTSMQRPARQRPAKPHPAKQRPAAGHSRRRARSGPGFVRRMRGRLGAFAAAIAATGRRLLARLGRGVRRVVRLAVWLLVLGAFVLYLPALYATALGVVPEESRQKLPTPEAVSAAHAQVVPPTARASIETGISDAGRFVWSAAVERWDAWTEEAPSAETP